MVGEILEDGQEVVLMAGGRGGLGNGNFATPTNQVPEYAQPGGNQGGRMEIAQLKVLSRCWTGLVFQTPVNQLYYL